MKIVNMKEFNSEDDRKKLFIIGDSYAEEPGCHLLDEKRQPAPKDMDQKTFWSPKNFLDVQKTFWTSKTFCWTSKKHLLDRTLFFMILSNETKSPLSFPAREALQFMAHMSSRSRDVEKNEMRGQEREFQSVGGAGESRR